MHHHAVGEADTWLAPSCTAAVLNMKHREPWTLRYRGDAPAFERTIWYGDQTLFFDAITAVIALAGTAADDSRWVTRLGLVGYAIGTPAIHVAHSHGGRGIISFAFRTLGLLGLAMVTPTLMGFRARDGSAGPVLGLVGAVSFLTVLGAPVVDAAIAYDVAPAAELPAAKLPLPARL